MGKERKEQAMVQPDKDGWVCVDDTVPRELWAQFDALRLRYRFKRGWVKVTSKVPDSVMHLFGWTTLCNAPNDGWGGVSSIPNWDRLTDGGHYWLRLKDQSLGFPQDHPSPQPDLAQPDEPCCVIKDSGVREDFPTGSRRDTRKGKGRFDLLPWLVVEMDAKFLEQGAEKYGDRNWEKGQPLSRYQDSAARHMCKWLMGMRDEPHALAARWNLAAFIWTAEMVRAGKLPKELDDVGETGMNEKKEAAA